MKYTVAELERMRSAIWNMYPTGVAYRQDERQSDVERRLTTYMANGTTPEELEEYVQEKRNEEMRRFEWMQRAIARSVDQPPSDAH